MNIIMLIIALLFGDPEVQANPIVNKPVPVAVERAMQKMGPRYQYKLLPDGRLYVDQGQGWKRLRY